MRVIAGKAKRLQLKTLDGLSTRPTTDRIKETLFNMIAPKLTDCDFLDLFSGSGGIGIEALSRGARSCVFVENNKAAIDCIKENLKRTNLLNEGDVLFMDALSSIRALEVQGKVFDIIFLDPPYNMGHEKTIIEALNNANIIYINTIIIVEASLETSFDFLKDTKFSVYKEKEYKTNKHVFIELS